MKILQLITNSNCKANSKGGYVLISVLVIMIVMLAITYFLADILFSELSIARNQKAGAIAFHLAEAGVQESIWRLQYDDTPNGAKEKFLNSNNGVTTFSHNSDALLENGSYEATITNTAPGAATIVATGWYEFGTKKAQRKIRASVTKATTPPPYTYDGAIFTGGSTGNEDIYFGAAEVNIMGQGSLISARNIEADFCNIQVEKDIISANDNDFDLSTVHANGDIRARNQNNNTLSNVTADGSIVDHDTTIPDYVMPTVDASSDDPSSYKSKAINQGQYYTQKQFDDLIHNQHNVNLSGVVYVAGGIDIYATKKNEVPPTVTITGMLVAENTINVGNPGKQGTLIINDDPNGPSGVIALQKFRAWAYSVINISGLLYIGDRFEFDPWGAAYAEDINIVGGILTRRLMGFGLRTLNITFNRDLINEGLRPDPEDPNDTPIIQFQHWEEEY